MFAICSIATSACVTRSAVGECPKQSQDGKAQFMTYRKHYGENAHVQDYLRLVQFCDAIRDKGWWEGLWD